uniref:Uncharacterized protein n=1 Tax=Chenopodium quinoa TaxID=63459 RepID=A0A803MTS0_CHEQI
ETVDWSSGISKVKEMRLVPSDPTQLETLFEVFCECAELNPEPMLGGDEEEHNWIFSADQLNAETLGGDASNWTFSENLIDSIGHSNGDHDLAQNVLQLSLSILKFQALG